MLNVWIFSVWSCAQFFQFFSTTFSEQSNSSVWRLLAIFKLTFNFDVIVINFAKYEEKHAHIYDEGEKYTSYLSSKHHQDREAYIRFSVLEIPKRCLRIKTSEIDKLYIWCAWSIFTRRYSFNSLNKKYIYQHSALRKLNVYTSDAINMAMLNQSFKNIAAIEIQFFSFSNSLMVFNEYVKASILSSNNNNKKRDEKKSAYDIQSWYRYVYSSISCSVTGNRKLNFLHGFHVKLPRSIHRMLLRYTNRWEISRTLKKM